jgi:Tfp pilus assembly protein PilO
MLETLTERERKLVLALVPVLLITVAVYFWTEPSAAEAPVLDKAAAVETARLRLEKGRMQAATLPALEENQKKLAASLAAWEKRLIQADTTAQAVVQLNQLFRRVARAQGSAVEIRSIDLGTMRPMGEYLEVMVNISFDCQVEGLVNLLTDLSSQPEYLTWRDLRIMSSDSKQKRIQVAFTVVAVAPVSLLKKTVSGAKG